MHAPAGIVFENDLDYTIRLRHDVVFDNTWFTSMTGRFNSQGSQISPKYVRLVVILQILSDDTVDTLQFLPL